MAEERTKKVVVAPDWICALYANQEFDGWGVGPVSYERSGVDNRRGYLSAWLTPAGWSNLEAILSQSGYLDQVTFAAKLPGNWRYMELM